MDRIKSLDEEIVGGKNRREGTLIKREIRVESVAVVISGFRLLVVRSSSLARFFLSPWKMMLSGKKFGIRGSKAKLDSRH